MLGLYSLEEILKIQTTHMHTPCIYMHTRTHLHTLPHIYMHTYTRTRIHTCAHLCTPTHTSTHLCTSADTCANPHTSAQTFAHPCIPSHTRAHPCTPAQTPHIPPDALNWIIHMKLHSNRPNTKTVEEQRKKEGTRVRWGDQRTKKLILLHLFFKYSTVITVCRTCLTNHLPSIK